MKSILKTHRNVDFKYKINGYVFDSKHQKVIGVKNYENEIYDCDVVVICKNV